MKLFKIYDDETDLNETYSEDCQKIWDYINERGRVNFSRRHLEDIWRDFSDRRYSAGFMEPDEDTLEKFVYYLANL